MPANLRALTITDTDSVLLLGASNLTFTESDASRTVPVRLADELRTRFPDVSDGLSRAGKSDQVSYDRSYPDLATRRFQAGLIADLLVSALAAGAGRAPGVSQAPR